MRVFPALELHCHLEGSLAPERLRALAERHGRPEVPRFCLDGTGDRYRLLEDFGSFLDLFKAIFAVLRTPADYHAAAGDLAERLAGSGVIHAEVIVAYGALQKLGVDPLPIQAALAEAAAAACENHGLEIRWLPDATRQFGVDAAWRALEAAVAAGPELGVTGFGLGGDEAAGPAADFAAVFAAARAEGLGAAIHAGEADGPESVRAAVELCGATRLGHGVAAAREPGLLDELAARGVFVELCPRSNLATGVVADAASHPLRAVVEAGVPCCLNTDDPAIFGLDLPGEYAWAEARHGLTRDEALRMQRQALAAAFIDGETRERLAARLEPPEDRDG